MASRIPHVVVFAILCSVIVYFSTQDLPYYLRPCTPVYQTAEAGDDFHVRGAPYTKASQLNSAEVDTVGGIPKIIHQSWKDGNLPNRFWDWSNSWRYHHPDWTWVLWTDEDNDALVSLRHPELNQTYWALKNAVQRADFVRNLYMWDFGGLYADLDMNCLRPLDSLLAHPYDHIASSYRTQDTGGAVAIVGSMETKEDDTKPHAIPNAFMASAPRHPLWLLPLSAILDTFHSETSSEADKYATERTTGPIVLYHAVQDYRTSSPRIHPALSAYTPVETHNVVILQPHLIYPFSWATESESGAVYSHCRASKYAHFEPEQCHGELAQGCAHLDLLKVYERGSRTITYWSHTWHQESGGEADLSIAGSHGRGLL